jgi:hypothetical protein
MKVWKIAVLVFTILVFLTGCSSTNTNGLRSMWTGYWIKASPIDAQTPGKIEFGGGYASATIIPLVKGQGVTFRAETNELISGHRIFAEEIIVYPVDADSIAKFSVEPPTMFKIPFIEIKWGDPMVTKTEVTPVK